MIQYNPYNNNVLTISVYKSLIWSNPICLQFDIYINKSLIVKMWTLLLYTLFLP